MTSLPMTDRAGMPTRRVVPSSSALPIEARRAAWSRLWQILLAEPCIDDEEQVEFSSGSEPTESVDTARASVGEEDVMMEV